MFIAVYEFNIKPGKEEQFRQSWLKTTQAIFKELGSLGSRLHSTDDPLKFVAYAQWPNMDLWANNNGLREHESILAIEDMRECIENSKTVYKLQVTDDYLQQTQYA